MVDFMASAKFWGGIVYTSERNLQLQPRSHNDLYNFACDTLVH